MAGRCYEGTDSLESPSLQAGLSRSDAATVSGTQFGDYANIHQGGQNVHVNHVVNNYASALPQSGNNAKVGSHHDRPSTPCWTVPFGRNKDFVGREPILDQLLEMIPPNADEDDCQRTVISGLGGVGKTQVALEAAFRVRGKYPDCHVFWVPAIDVTTFENAYREIGRGLNIQGIDDNAADVKSLVKSALRQSAEPWLLVIDNADEMALFTETTEGASLSDSLPFSLMGSILFTTRNGEISQSLDIRRQHILHLTELSRSEAANMLGRFLSPRQMSDKQSMEDLLDFLNDLPLAIKQASSYMIKTRMVVSKYLEQCRLSDEHLIELLSKDFNDRARYKSTENPIATTWLISFRAVSRDSPLAAKYLHSMAFFAEKNIPKQLLPLGDDELKAYEAIGVLQAYAFINEREGEGAFDMHRLVRLVMQNWLLKEGTLQATITAVIQQLNVVFPWPGRSNKDVWAKFLSHLITALKFQDHSSDHSSRATLLSKTGRGLHFLGNYVDAKQIHQQALDLRTIALGPENPDTLTSMNDLAMNLDQLGQYKEAEQMHRQVLELRMKILGAEHPDTLTGMNDLASDLHQLGQYKEAKQMYRQVLKLRTKILGADHPDTLASRNNLALNLYRLGQYKEAEQLHRQVLKLQIKILGAEHPDTLASRNNLALKILGTEHPDTLASWNNLAIHLYGLGQYKEAEQMHREVLRLRIKVLGAEHPKTINSRENLASALRQLGQYEEA
ncbi:P-loop containing nucleoside triphosphate hydrolase protein [Trichoderma chlorosporum]